MSQKGSGLARLMGRLSLLDVNADALAERLEIAMADLDNEMATTSQIIGTVENSVNDLRSVNALYSNGAPSPTPGSPGPSQGIRARRMQELGLLDVLHPDELSPQALTAWLAREPGAPPPTRGRVDLGGLTRIPGLLAELLGVPAGAVQPAGSAAAEVGLT